MSSSAHSHYRRRLSTSLFNEQISRVEFKFLVLDESHQRFTDIDGVSVGDEAPLSRFNDTHPSVVWLKFAALAEGARLATQKLWT